MTLFSSNNQKVSVTFVSSSNTVEITYFGSSDVWYGIGFGHTTMANTYAIIIQATDSNPIFEQLLGNHDPGETLPSTITVVSNIVVDNIRKVVITRNMTIDDSRYYSFSFDQTRIPVIFAFGVNPQLNQHLDNDAQSGTLNMNGTSTENSSGGSDKLSIVEMTMILLGVGVLMAAIVLIWGYMNGVKHRGNVSKRDHLKGEKGQSLLKDEH
ncbi:hypothetical protein RFI_15610 [Reticulomyxa filosa]|uniref:DOMON domain-containing protein n=1 Tax=Reticulomyxa filosa TaxID=46433 RepID=X6N6L9_RETFI|nr:hypothetical protein RFI_15610 [Reticulomyxa filosa]|eukprot:ETO21593.1 hypothetical protein RFI_15610 [Reticulomyxa filosa]